MGKQIINGDVEITGQLLRGDLKALYHLGAYDSVDTTNADYDVITRGTGYVDCANATWTSGTSGISGMTYWETTLSGAVIGTTEHIPNVECSDYALSGSNTYPTSTNYGVFVFTGTTITIYSQTRPSGSIYYELATPYTERVLKNQPLSTLDQARENWLRGMYEKQLNLSFIESATTSSTKTYTLSKTVPAGTYTIRFNFSRGANDSVWFEFGYGDGTNHKTIGLAQVSGTITSSLTCSTETTFYLKFVISSGTLSASNIMLNSGSTALPYQPYNGKVMHAIDVEGVKLWENATPNASFAAQTITTASMSGYNRLLIVHKTWGDVGVIKSVAEFIYNTSSGSEGGTLSYASGTNVLNRDFTIATSSSITFAEGKMNGSDNSRALVPIAIYGIK